MQIFPHIDDIWTETKRLEHASIEVDVESNNNHKLLTGKVNGDLDKILNSAEN